MYSKPGQGPDSYDKSLIRSLLEYCCPLWNPSKVTEIQMIEGVQRTFTSRVGGLQHLNYWERLKQLKIMLLQRRRERYIILMMWKILHNLAPNCCNIQFKVTARHGVVASIPPLSKASSSSNQSLYDSSFAVQGPKLVWNKAPAELKAAQSFEAFKSSLSNFLALIPRRTALRSSATAAVGQIHWLATLHHGGQTSDDPSGSTDKPYEVTK